MAEEKARRDAREMICIACPVGCRLTVYRGADDEVHVEGNACPRGDAYGKQEYTAPERVVTTTVALEGGMYPRLPVKTAKAVPKAKVGEVLRAIRGVRARTPVEVGSVLLRDAAGTGVDVVATRSA